MTAYRSCSTRWQTRCFYEERRQTNDKTRQRGNMTGKRYSISQRGQQRETPAGLTDAVQSVNGDGFKSAPHHRVLLQHLVEMVDRQREESTVGVRTHAGGSPALGQQTDLCAPETQGDRGKTRCKTEPEASRRTEAITSVITAHITIQMDLENEKVLQQS